MAENEITQGCTQSQPSSDFLTMIQNTMLTSDHKKCTHFVLNNRTGFHSSTTMTSADICWIEQANLLPPGTLFRLMAGGYDCSPSEYSWEPCRRWTALSPMLRQPRGHKSDEHLVGFAQSTTDHTHAPTTASLHVA